MLLQSQQLAGAGCWGCLTCGPARRAAGCLAVARAPAEAAAPCPEEPLLVSLRGRGSVQISVGSACFRTQHACIMCAGSHHSCCAGGLGRPAVAKGLPGSLSSPRRPVLLYSSGASIAPATWRGLPRPPADTDRSMPAGSAHPARWLGPEPIPLAAAGCTQATVGVRQPPSPPGVQIRRAHATAGFEGGLTRQARCTAFPDSNVRKVVAVPGSDMQLLSTA